MPYKLEDHGHYLDRRWEQGQTYTAATKAPIKAAPQVLSYFVGTPGGMMIVDAMTSDPEEWGSVDSIELPLYKGAVGRTHTDDARA